MLILRSAAKMLEHEVLDDILAAIDPLLLDSDKFKQRGGAEILAGVLRGPYISDGISLHIEIDGKSTGSKHWSSGTSEKLWTWTTDRLGRIFGQIKPDTLSFWEGFFHVSFIAFKFVPHGIQSMCPYSIN
jgi:proteasome activator subunit 4